MQIVSEACTHRGAVRQRNEDAFVARDDLGLWAVADGAGGYGAGDVASAAVQDSLASLPLGLSAAELMVQVRLRLAAVHASLQGRMRPDGQRQILASTVVILMARRDHYACLWAGDSRAYVVRGGKLLRITKDHSLVQNLVDAGLVLPEDAKSHPQGHVITRAVGSDGPLELDKVSDQIAPGDLFLLCSDGLYAALPETTILQALRENRSASELIASAVDAGAHDNVTAVIVRVGAEDDGRTMAG